MNPAVVEEQQLPQPPQQTQPHRISTSCDRHPDEHFTGFCPSCLCERLAVLDQSASTSTAVPARKSASSAIKSIFRSATGNGNNPNPNPAGERPTFRTRPGSFLPELRRTKSFSGSGGRGDGTGIFEPQRKSCDVRGRSTLWTLFNQDDVKRVGSSANPKKNDNNNNNNNNEASAAATCTSSRVGIEQTREVKFNYNDQRSLVIELEEGKETVNEIEEEIPHLYPRKVAETSEIEEVEEPVSSNPSSRNPKFSGEGEQLGEILETGEKEEEVEELVEFKPMKDHIDLHSSSQSKKPSGGGGGGGKDLKELAGSFWSAASVFSKKLRSWTKKNNHNGPKTGKKHGGGGHSRLARALGKKRYGGGRSYRETQSEIADYGFGRRSCDTDPRFSIDAGRMSLDYGRMSLDAGRMSLDAGRMSYDAGRMSLDAGRMSFDDPRYSFDEPRASWDGYLIGGVLGRSSTSSFPRMPPMVSVVEDPHPHPPPPSHLSHVSTHHHHLPPPPPPAVTTVTRKDNLIPLEEQFQLPRNSTCSTHEEDQNAGGVPGGALQTKDYYSDSSSRRRKSLDRSSSVRKTAAMVVAEMDEMKSSSNGGGTGNAKVTPATAADCGVGIGGGCNVGGRVSFSGEKDLLRDPNLNNTLRGGLGDDYYSGSFDMGWRGGIDNAGSVVGGCNEERKGGNSGKKSRRWRSWNIWGMIIRRGNNKEEDEDGRYSSSRPNGVERSFSESWGELGGRDAAYAAVAGGDPRVGLNNRGMFRSNSSVSWRNSYSNSNGSGGANGLFNGSGGNGGSSSLRRNGGGGGSGGGHAKKKSNEFVLERNRSGRYSPPPTHSDNSLLRFYLTPMRGSRRGGVAPGKTKPSAAYSHAIARSVLRMY